MNTKLLKLAMKILILYWVLYVLYVIVGGFKMKPHSNSIIRNVLPADRIVSRFNTLKKSVNETSISDTKNSKHAIQKTNKGLPPDMVDRYYPERLLIEKFNALLKMDGKMNKNKDGVEQPPLHWLHDRPIKSKRIPDKTPVANNDNLTRSKVNSRKTRKINETLNGNNNNDHNRTEILPQDGKDSPNITQVARTDENHFTRIVNEVFNRGRNKMNYNIEISARDIKNNVKIIEETQSDQDNISKTLNEIFGISDNNTVIPNIKKIKKRDLMYMPRKIIANRFESILESNKSYEELYPEKNTLIASNGNNTNCNSTEMLAQDERNNTNVTEVAQNNEEDLTRTGNETNDVPLQSTNQTELHQTQFVTYLSNNTLHNIQGNNTSTLYKLEIILILTSIFINYLR